MNKINIYRIAVVVLCVVLFLTWRHKCTHEPEERVRIEKTSDTVYISMIIRDTIREPYRVEVVKRDTIYLTAEQPDTPQVLNDIALIIPITRKSYRTDNYNLTISGWHPELLNIEITAPAMYINNKETITKVRNPRFALTVGVGFGYGINGFSPYLGLNFGFVLWSSKK